MAPHSRNDAMAAYIAFLKENFDLDDGRSLFKGIGQLFDK